MRYFENAKVGDKVRCMMWGEGEIGIINENEIYVSFDIQTGWYDFSGKYQSYANQTLFYADDYPLVYYPDWDKFSTDIETIDLLLYTYENSPFTIHPLHLNNPLPSSVIECERFHHPQPKPHTIVLDGKEIEISNKVYLAMKESLE